MSFVTQVPDAEASPGNLLQSKGSTNKSKASSGSSPAIFRRSAASRPVPTTRCSGTTASAGGEAPPAPARDCAP